METREILEKADRLIKSNEKLLSTLQNKRDRKLPGLSKERLIEMLKHDLLVDAILIKSLLLSDVKVARYLNRFIYLGELLAKATGQSFEEVVADVLRKA